jgi:sRNA-binding regulator protein Hfq
MRAVAQAAVDALRPVLERSGGRPTLEALNFVPFAGTTVALAAVSVVFEHSSVLRVGAEAVTGGEAEAVVQAVLGAVGKASRPPVPAGTRPDRQRQFEGLRRQYERLIRMAEGAPPPAEVYLPEETGTGAAAEGAPPPLEPLQPEPPPAERQPPESVQQVPTHPEPHRAEPPRAVPTPEDVVRSMAEIRPEREGGAPIAMREEFREHAGPAAKTPPRQSIEDAFYRRLVNAGSPVHIRCRDGYEIPAGVVREYGTYSLLIEADGVQELVFKHGIIAIRPHGPLPPEPSTLPS